MAPWSQGSLPSVVLLTAPHLVAFLHLCPMNNREGCPEFIFDASTHSKWVTWGFLPGLLNWLVLRDLKEWLEAGGAGGESLTSALTFKQQHSRSLIPTSRNV